MLHRDQSLSLKGQPIFQGLTFSLASSETWFHILTVLCNPVVLWDHLENLEAGITAPRDSYFMYLGRGSTITVTLKAPRWLQCLSQGSCWCLHWTGTFMNRPGLCQLTSLVYWAGMPFGGFMVEYVIEGVPGYSCGCRSSSHLPADKRVGVIGA